MKIITATAILLVSVFFMSTSKTFNYYTNENYTGFTADSGYIFKNDLIDKINFNTTDSIYQLIYLNESDTVGKYYKGYNNHYFSCFDVSRGFFEYLIVESLGDGSILKMEIYQGGTHICCWESRFEGFKKYGDYIGFKSCTTGTAVCGGSVYLFKNLKSQDSIKSIPQNLWYSLDFNKTYRDITSNFTIINDTVYVSYHLIDYKEKRNKQRIKNEKNFDIRYTENKGIWVSLDTTSYLYM